MVDIFTAGVFILGVSNKNHGISVIKKTQTLIALSESKLGWTSL